LAQWSKFKHCIAKSVVIVVIHQWPVHFVSALVEANSIQSAPKLPSGNLLVFIALISKALFLIYFLFLCEEA
jgi:hypothetical protein